MMIRLLPLLLATTLLAAAGCAAATPEEPPPVLADTGQSAAEGALAITLASEPNPPVVGDARFIVTVTGPDGRPVADADVALEFDMAPMPQMNMPAMHGQAALSHVDGGRYEGTADVMMAGPWEITVVVSRGDEPIGRQVFPVTAR